MGQDLATQHLAAQRGSRLHPGGTVKRFRTGERVEVRRRFDQLWARGFQVIADDDSGYRIKRESDGVILPVMFPASELRTARNLVD